MLLTWLLFIIGFLFLWFFLEDLVGKKDALLWVGISMFMIGLMLVVTATGG